MQNPFRVAYTLWGALWFWLGYLFQFPLFFLIVQKKKWHKYAYWPNKIWAFITYFSIAIPVRQRYHFKPDSKGKYIYCANHTSYLDIPLIGLTTPHFVKFIGKSSLGEVPVFGYMFKRLHITVDRTKVKSRYESFKKAAEEVDEGFSLAIFPEGQLNMDAPKTNRFKDGAFRIAIEKNIPIVPVTIPFHWKILPDKAWLSWHRTEIIYHEPIPTENLTIAQLDELKLECQGVIDRELSKHFPTLMNTYESKN